jgi:hypothetical protein
VSHARDIAVFFITAAVGSVALYMSPSFAVSARYGHQEPLFVASILAVSAVGLALGYVFDRHRSLRSCAVGWVVAGLCFLMMSPRQAEWYSHMWPNDCPDVYLRFAPDGLPGLGYHVFVFFLLILPVVGTMAALNGRRFADDGRCSHLLIFGLVILVVCVLLASNNAVFDWLPHDAKWSIIGH